MKKLIKNNKPTHWALSWGLTIELGFANGTYLPRKPAILLYPEYFDEKGEPKIDTLPLEDDKGE